MDFARLRSRTVLIAATVAVCALVGGGAAIAAKLAAPKSVNSLAIIDRQVKRRDLAKRSVASLWARARPPAPLARWRRSA